MLIATGVGKIFEKDVDTKYTGLMSGDSTGIGGDKVQGGERTYGAGAVRNQCLMSVEAESETEAAVVAI